MSVCVALLEELAVVAFAYTLNLMSLMVVANVAFVVIGVVEAHALYSQMIVVALEVCSLG